MRTFQLTGAVLAASLLLSGCITIPKWGGKDQGCKPQYEQNGSWVFQGLEIPIHSSLIGPIKIGQVNYTPQDYASVTETLRLLDTARLGNCSLTTSSNFYLISQATRDIIFLKVAASNDAIVAFAARLRNAAAPEEVRTAQRDAANVVPTVKPPIDPPPTPTSMLDSEARGAAASLAMRVDGLSHQVAQLEQDLERATRSSTQRVQVTGFEPNGVALTADQRSAVLANFRKAIAAVPTHRMPTVLFVGYADGSGIQGKGVDLALRRATNVAEFLRRHEFGRDFHTQVTIGNPASQVSGEYARHVDIVVSRLAQDLAAA